MARYPCAQSYYLRSSFSIRLVPISFTPSLLLSYLLASLALHTSCFTSDNLLFFYFSFPPQVLRDFQVNLLDVIFLLVVALLNL